MKRVATNQLVKKSWELCIGIELHAQVQSVSKLFSGGAAEKQYHKQYGGPNSQVALFDVAIPGTLPRLNQHCVEQAVKTGIALGGKIHKVSTFERKHYFYADMPQGFQITQQKHPISSNGSVNISVPKSRDNSKRFEVYERKINISQLQIEQDSGKSVKDVEPTKTLLDFNRAGCALMEIISEPDMRSSLEAAAYVKKIQRILRHIGSCDGNMEDGSLRCDVNVSIRPQGETDLLGERTEIKNLNSIKGIVNAIDFEYNRQIELAESGNPIQNKETRSFDAATGETSLMRKKEGSSDYRFMPEPDLPPLVVSEAFIREARTNIPELPDALEDRLHRKYDLSKYETSVLVDEPGAVKYFEVVMGMLEKGDSSITGSQVWNLLINEVLGRLNNLVLPIKSCLEDRSLLPPKNFVCLITMQEQGSISGKIVKKVLDVVFDGDDHRDHILQGGDPGEKDPEIIVTKNNWFQITDTGVITDLCNSVLADEKYADEIARYVDGSAPKLFGFFVGTVLKKSGGKANPKLVNSILKGLLDARRRTPTTE